ncbi:MAG: hypothetical protein IPP86_01525 [Bacteroidetes bacterium]|nr:hypothetical protein [Bacteroidota bacterium]
MKPLIQILILIFLAAGAHSQTLSPKVMPSCGGFATGINGKTLSWTMGEPFNTTLSSANNKLTQGFQQPEISVYIVNIKALIEGFYIGSGMMTAVIDPFLFPLQSDTLTLQLARNVAPYDIQYSATTILSTDGNAKFNFPIETSGNTFYLVLKHRNALQTWSVSPVTINYNMQYDFTISASQAYGSNLTDLGDGRFALFSGDVNQDESIGSSDYSAVENASQNFLSGYLHEDLTGDNIVESADYSLIENNNQLIIIASHP